jgi:outer membrane protein OmpA-like peptidoglycan-associated protein
MKYRILACIGILALTLAAQNNSSPAVRRASNAQLETDNKDIKLGEDEAGCKDSALLARIPGCSIIQCDTKESGSLELQVGISTDGVIQKELMEGPSEVIYYLCPAKVSLSNIVKTSDGALVKAGFKVVFNGKDDEDQPIVTASKENQWVQVSTYMYKEYGAYILSVIKDMPESQPTSEALADEITKAGRVTLAGLSFEADNTEMPADAEKVLAEVAAILMRQPQLKIRVEAQGGKSTDKQSTVATANKRASAIASWLLSHGIDQSRVSTEGGADPVPGQSVDIVRF